MLPEPRKLHETLQNTTDLSNFIPIYSPYLKWIKNYIKTEIELLFNYYDIKTIHKTLAVYTTATTV